MVLLYMLFDIALAAEEEAPGFTLQEIWTSSGPIAKGVIVMLVIMLIGTIYTAIERMIAFNRSRAQSMAVAAQIVAPLQGNDIEGALKIAKSEEYKASYLAAILAAGLAEVQLRTDSHGLQNAERAIHKAIVEEQGKMRRGMNILATTGSTAPFVGLFGTTFGVINAFQGMATAGSGLASISKGISEALITTGVGIGVAVVGVWFFNYFNGRIEKVNDEMAASEADFEDWAHKLVVDRQENQAKAGK